MCSKNAANVEEMHTGYLYKSPPAVFIKNMISWKRRLFVLAKTGDSNYELRYYRNNKKDKPIKSIDVSSITELDCPKEHSFIEWICKAFKCTPSSVLFMKAENPKDKVQREYFFIGETSKEADGWFNALLQVLKHNKYSSDSVPWNMTELNSRQISSTSKPVPLNINEPKSTDDNSDDSDQSGGDCVPPLPPKRISVHEYGKTENHRCDQQHRRQPSTLEEVDHTAGESGKNIKLSSGERNSLLDCVTKVFNDMQTYQKSDEGKETPSETQTTKEICLRLDDLSGLNLTEEAGKPCVSECEQTEVTCLLHKGDQIVAVNGLRTDTVEDVKSYLGKINGHEVKLTILQHPNSNPLHSEETEDIV
ncbi:pleckstrin homology domain-containing family S member 1 isoform X2 [Paramisgurnus dabryanus]|uniref:pleckstrin homology domain-containing family S member 1 isoform X2 n=1 Tax=Paramisgurnus dabryanus TaxID=90735 RepID=UPI003CCF8B6D